MESQHSSAPAQLSMLVKPPQIFPKFPFLSLSFFLILSFTSATDVPYSRHCNDVVPEYPTSSNPILRFKPLNLGDAHVTGGEDSRTNPSSRLTAKTLWLDTEKAYRTQNDDVFKLYGLLSLTSFRASHLHNLTVRRGLRLVHYRPPRIPFAAGSSSQRKFSLSGFWNSTSGKLCMVGSSLGSDSGPDSGEFSLVSHVVLKLDYLNSSNIYNSLVNGTLESLDIDDRNAYFNPLSIIGMNMRSYKYELIDKETERHEFDHLEDLVNVSIGSELWRITDVIRSVRSVDLEYKRDCDIEKCYIPVGGIENFIRPSVMYFHKIDFDEGGYVRYLLTFGDQKHNRWFMPLDPKVTLVSEGKWDSVKKRLNMVGCQILSGKVFGKNLVGDCSVRLSLRMPSRWTLRERNAVVGEMWSSKGLSESGYFSRVELRSSSNGNARSGIVTYEYGEIWNVRKQCSEKIIHEGKKGGYPGLLSTDMRFDMVVTDRKGEKYWGYSSPLTIGDRFYQQNRYVQWEGLPVIGGSHNDSSVVNVSYMLSFRSLDSTKFTEISAEGFYDPNSGHLCMIGCKHITSPNGQLGNNNVSVDCDVLINVQYAKLNEKYGASTKGTIESTRNTSDSLYFEPLEISSHSLYEGQARNSIWRVDFEITMVLISNTLTCLFLGMQLYYVRKNPSVLPSVSLMMLVVLTLAHMIPLILNFEAMFLANRNRQNVYFGSDGWLEVNEMLVRVITMIAFLLELYLLQLTCSARGVDSNQKSFWISEKKVLYLSLPLYVAGGLISWFVYVSGKSIQRPYHSLYYRQHQKQSLWGGLKSYAGLTLDGFLLPQVLFNMFSDSRGKALAHPFYVGTTIVRLLPHAYDLYRARSSTWSFSYIYATPRMDYYSTAWDIIISAVGIILVLLIFLQQRFGGRCFLPNRFRQSSVYEKVPAVNSEQL